MSILASFWKMSLEEYVDYIELSAIHRGVEADELNREYRFEIGVIDDKRYEEAKWELVRRDMMFNHYGEY